MTVTLDTPEKEPIERQHTPKLDDTTENDYSESVITYQISTLSMSAMEDGMKSANRSAAVSRMSNNIETVVNEQTVEMEQTDRASPSLLKKMEKTMEQSVVDSYTELQVGCSPIKIFFYQKNKEKSQLFQEYDCEYSVFKLLGLWRNG